MGGKVSGDWRKADRLFGNDPAGLDESARGIVVLVAVGLLVGVLSGMFGIGGGTVIVPALVWLGLSQRNAAATSMLAIVPTAISGVVSYAAGGNVDWLAAALLFCGMFVGGQVGSWLLSRLPELVLRWIFRGVSRVCGDQSGEFRAVTRPPDHYDGGDRCLHGATGCGHRHAGGIAGVLVAARLAVPALSILFGASDLIARGTSLLAMFPNSITTSVANLKRNLVHVKAALIIGVGWRL